MIIDLLSLSLYIYIRMYLSLSLSISIYIYIYIYKNEKQYGDGSYGKVRFDLVNADSACRAESIY